MKNALIIDGEQVTVPFEVINRMGELPTRLRAETPTQVVLHVDITFNSSSTEKVLKARGLSTHFGVDGDSQGTVWQWADPVDHATFHAGKANEFSIGIDVNTPLNVDKYAERDYGHRGRYRTVIHGESQGKMREVLGLFPEQLRNLFALALVLETECGIPIVYPDWTDKGPLDGWRDWPGWLGHHHVPTSHWCPGPVGQQVASYFEQELAKVSGSANTPERAWGEAAIKRAWRRTRSELHLADRMDETFFDYLNAEAPVVDVRGHKD